MDRCEQGWEPSHPTLALIIAKQALPHVMADWKGSIPDATLCKERGIDSKCDHASKAKFKSAASWHHPNREWEQPHLEPSSSPLKSCTLWWTSFNWRHSRQNAGLQKQRQISRTTYVASSLQTSACENEHTLSPYHRHAKFAILMKDWQGSIPNAALSE